MSLLTSIAITTGILSGFWSWLADFSGLLTWAGFVGCTLYFASEGGSRGLITTWLTGVTGVAWAMVSISGISLLGSGPVAYIITALVAFLMCMQGKSRLLAYIPGTFAGSCALFASGGDWLQVVPSMVIGTLLGHIMKTSGVWLHSRLHQSQPVS